MERSGGKPRWRGAATRAAMLLVLLLGMGLLAAAAALRWSAPEPAAVLPPPQAVGLGPAERAYYDYVAPRLAELSAEASVLAELGQTRSRDILELNARGRRLESLVQEIDAYVADHGTPDRFVTVSADLQRGARLAQEGVAEARRGVLMLDWDRVGRAVDTFAEGADRIEAATIALEQAGTAPGA